MEDFLEHSATEKPSTNIRKDNIKKKWAAE